MEKWEWKDKTQRLKNMIQSNAVDKMEWWEEKSKMTKMEKIKKVKREK